MTHGEQRRPYRFGSFDLDPAQRILLRDGIEVPLTLKAFEMLLVLVERAGQVVEKEELMSRLWPDSFVEENNLTVHKSALARALGEGYIQTVPKRGYRFVAGVQEVERAEERAQTAIKAEAKHFDAAQNEAPRADGADEPVVELQPQAARRSDRQWRGLMALGLIMLVSLAAIVYVWRRAANAGDQRRGERVQVHSPSDEEEIKRVVKESQMFEFLTLDTDPAAADDRQLAKYWLPAEQGGKEMQNVKASIKKLIGKDWHYGKDSRLELFDFRYVRVFSPKDYAEAGTSERWYLPMQRADGSRVEDRNVYFGVYDIDYTLRKVNGAWLIEEASTPRSSK
ncbi:MAG: transcriptional regulator [Pyrinomonadaceae bacterium]